MDVNFNPKQGQNGELSYVELHWDRLKMPANGVFCEVGAYDGVTGSTSIWLERTKGWQGVIVEPDPRKQKTIIATRNCVKEFCAAGGETGEMDLFMRSGQVTSLMKESRHRTVETKRVPVKRVDEILRTNGFDHVDFLSIDTEGTELECWASVGEFKRGLKAVIMEALTPEQVRKTIEALAVDGFRLETSFGYNYIFVPKDAAPESNTFTPIVFPLHYMGGDAGNDFEFRMTLRSWAHHFNGEMKIAVASAFKPPFLTDDVIYIPCVKVKHDGTYEPRGLKSSMHIAAGMFPHGYIWAYDDTALLIDEYPETIRVAHSAGTKWLAPTTKWRKACWKVKERLEKVKLPIENFSEPHGCYWLTLKEVKDAFHEWPGLEGRFPVESWILNKRHNPARQNKYHRLLHKQMPTHVPAGAHIFNWSHESYCEAIRTWLMKRFPAPSRWERS